jgi:hypothetical protein
VVAAVALFFVLDRLDVVHAAGGCSRGRAGGRGACLVAAGVLVYDLEAHAGDETGERGRLHGGGRLPDGRRGKASRSCV